MNREMHVRFVENDLECIPHRHRQLEPGEMVDGSRILGFPCRVGGPGVRVAIWGDDRETATIPPQAVSIFRQMEAIRLILSAAESFSGAQVRLIRREIGMTQAEMAEKLGINRSGFNQIESKNDRTNKTKTLAIKYIARPYVPGLAEKLDPHNRELNRRFIEAMQEALNEMEEISGDVEFQVDDVSLCYA